MRNNLMQLARFIVISLVAFMLLACAALETSRNVYVNGERQNALGVAAFDIQTGRTLPDGRYWMNSFTGDWGVEGKKKAIGNIRAGSVSAPAANTSRNNGSVSNSVNGTAGTGRDADGNNCAFVSLPDGAGMMTCD